MQDNRQAVNFWFDDKLCLLHAVIYFFDAFKPGAGIVRAKGVGERENCPRVANLLETVGRLGDSALRGAVGCDPIGVRSMSFARAEDPLSANGTRMPKASKAAAAGGVARSIPCRDQEV